MMLLNSRSVICVLILSLLTGSLVAEESVTVELTKGGKIEGSILKKDSDSLVMMVGGIVLTIESKDIKTMTTGGEIVGAQNISAFKLYQTARLPMRNTAALVEDLSAAIVVVKTPSGLGTGWFCHPDGYIITNAHVIDGEQSISVTAFKREGERFEKKIYKNVKLVALTDTVDLALLKIEEPLDMTIPQLYLCADEGAKKGDKSFAIGNPLGLERTVSEGIISTVSREFDGRLYIQTTTQINPGNSGGPLFNERGEVIGVTNMGYIFLDGLGFAIPVRYVKEFLDNVEAYAYDSDNPNSRLKYLESPIISDDKTVQFTSHDFVKIGRGSARITAADVNGDGVDEIVFVDNNKAEIGVVSRRVKAMDAEKTMDYEDINKLPESQLFEITRIPVNGRITNIVVEDVSGDKRPDIVYYSAIDGLAVLEQNADGTFKTMRKITSDVKPSQRNDALQLADFDGDGLKEIFVLESEKFIVFEMNGDKTETPISASYRTQIRKVIIDSSDAKKRPSILFLSNDMFYAAHAFVQNAQGQYVEEQKISSMLSGPVEPYKTKRGGRQFLALDSGKNRVRELTLANEPLVERDGAYNMAIRSIPFDPSSALNRIVETLDINKDGRADIICTDRSKNEFVVYIGGKDGFEPVRSPSPKSIDALTVYQAEDGTTAIFCYSKTDKLFGVSRIEDGKVSYPRPLNIDGEIEYLDMVALDGGKKTSLVWIEKTGTNYVIKSASAPAVTLAAFDGKAGSIDIVASEFAFGKDAASASSTLKNKPMKATFVDFNSDGVSDAILYLAYSNKESLYLGIGGGKFKEIIEDKKIFEEKAGQPLLVVDIDADENDDVLYVQNDFIRVLRVDEKEKLYVANQFNWKVESIANIARFPGGDRPRFVALTSKDAVIVEIDPKTNTFDVIQTIDMTGIGAETAKPIDINGNGKTDILLIGNGVFHCLYQSTQRPALESRVVFNANQDNFTYWNLFPVDLNGDGADDVLLFDSKRAMFEIYRADATGELHPLSRHRLFARSIFQRRDTGAYEIPNDIIATDMNGDAMKDLVFLLDDRLAIYFQGKEK